MNEDWNGPFRIRVLEEGYLVELPITHRQTAKKTHNPTNTRCGMCGGELWQNRDNRRLVHLDRESWNRHQLMVMITKGARA